MDERARRQIDRFCSELSPLVGENLVGIYLHGSLAMDCFNPWSSDIDLIVRTRERLDERSRTRIGQLMLEHSCNPFPMEISILGNDDLLPWCYPTPYTFHYGEELRDQIRAGVRPQGSTCGSAVDYDLAAHITVIQARGITLSGEPVASVFPRVPEKDYLDSILRDLNWALERLQAHPVYAVLNVCRVYYYLSERAISSKQEAGEWALDEFPDEFCAVIKPALRCYRGDEEAIDVPEDQVEQSISSLAVQIAQLAHERRRRDLPG